MQIPYQQMIRLKSQEMQEGEIIVNDKSMAQTTS